MSSPALAYPVLDSLIGQFEGFGKPGTPATLNNNPGNIISGPFAESHGATGVSGNFAVFPDVATGLAAQDSLTQHYANQNASISDLINSWAPPNAPGNTPESTQNYIDFISGKLGVPATTPISATSGIAGTLGSAISGINPLGMLGGINPLSSVGFSWGRIGAFLIGLILVAGGIYLFKPVQQTVNRAARTALL